MSKKIIQEAVNVIIFSRDRKEILLIKRRDIPVWVLPGGGIEPEETPEKAAVREAEEETGFSVAITRKIAHYFPINRLSQVTHFYECSIVSGAPKTGKETKEVRFYPLAALPRHLAPPYQDWIQDALENQTVVMKKKILSSSYWNLVRLLILHPILVARFLLTKMGIHINTQ